MAVASLGHGVTLRQLPRAAPRRHVPLGPWAAVGAVAGFSQSVACHRDMSSTCLRRVEVVARRASRRTAWVALLPLAARAEEGLTKIGNDQFNIELPKGFSWNERLECQESLP